MNDFEHKDYFNARFCYHGDEQKVTAILDSYVQNQIELADINRVIELYIQNYFLMKVNRYSGLVQKKNIRDIKTKNIEFKIL